MQRITILRNTYLAAYTEVARDHGIDPKPLLEKHGIPPDFELIPEFVQPARPLHGFIRDASELAPPGAISTAAGFYNAARQPNPFMHAGRISITLLDAIESHNDHVTSYSPENRFGFDTDDTVGYWRKLGQSPVPETEIFCIANLIGHVQTFLGSAWLPPVIGVSRADPGALRGLPLYQEVSVVELETDTVLQIPLEKLSTPMRGWKSSITRLSPLKMEDSGFLESLRLVMRSYARVGDSGIDAIARALGLSRRTLQRRISASGLTFSKLSDQVRYELSCSLLVEQTDMGVTEIGYELGYRDPGSFTRAFRRFAGITPRHYRRLNSNTATQSAA